MNYVKLYIIHLDARPNENMTVEELEELTLWSNTVQECCVNKSE